MRMRRPGSDPAGIPEIASAGRRAILLRLTGEEAGPRDA